MQPKGGKLRHIISQILDHFFLNPSEQSQILYGKTYELKHNDIGKHMI